MMAAMRELPVGTVTFLFTDIEGSTRLLGELGTDRYALELAEHRRVLREAIAACGGVEVDTQGDSFFVAFADAQAALATARQAQEKLAPGPILVRMGLHTGEPLVTEDGYVGMDVHRAARIAAAGHGGQILLSEQARLAVGDEDVRSLGLHRLKDLTAPEPLYQYGDREFPPLASLNQSNLPVQATPFVGRERELAEVLARLRDPRIRLLTLTGPGGTGKTRLAVQAAAELVRDYPHGVWWVDLQAVREASLVVPTIASTLGAKGDLAAHIATRTMLIVLDNLEQVVEAAPQLAALLASCPQLELLATSREPLHIGAEHEHPIRPFVEEEGVGFFLGRARASDPAFVPDDAVRLICRRLDQLPLALELAAARTKVLSTRQLLDRLEQRLPVLTGGPRDAPERQRTLRATIEWSHDLLSPDEQRLFARLCVFAGGCTLDAAGSVCDAELDLLQSLVDKSLLRFDAERFAMLETIREYARDRLAASGEADAIGRRHLVYFLELALSAGLSDEADGPQRIGLVIPEQDNMRAALDFAAAADPELALRLAVALENFWVAHSPFEGIQRFESLLAASPALPTDLRAPALRASGGAVSIVGRWEEGTLLFERSLAAYRELGDERGIGLLLHRLSVSAHASGDAARARELAREGLERSKRLGIAKGEALALYTLGLLDFEEGRQDEGLAELERSAALAGEIGFVWFQAGTLAGLADCARQAGRLPDCERWARQALAAANAAADRQWTIVSLALLAYAAATRGDASRAGLLWGAIEREEQRGPVGQWEAERDVYATTVLALSGPELERGREAGRALSLAQAVEHVAGHPE
jgi:predicted ATPase/class 3 adenylate cyclase